MSRPVKATPARSSPPPPPAITSVSRPQLWGLCLIAAILVGGGGLAVGHYAPRIPMPNDRLHRDTAAAAPDVRSWALRLGIALLVLTVVTALLGMRRYRNAVRRVRLLATIAGQLKIPPEQLRLRATWRRGRLRAARIRYPAGAVVADPSLGLCEACVPVARARLAAQWRQHKDLIELRAAADTDSTISLDQHPALAAPTAALAQLLPGLTITAAETRISAENTPEQVGYSYHQTTKDTSPSFRARVRYVLDQKSPSPTGAWAMSWRPDLHRLTLSPSKPLPTLVSHPGAVPAPLRTAAIGVRETGTAALWRPVINPHLLVAGTTGGGKTAALRALVTSVTAAGWIVYICDPKRLSFRGMRSWPGLVELATHADDMATAIGAVHTEMEHRYAKLETFDVAEDDLTPVVLVMDELAELLAVCNQAWLQEGNKGKHPVAEQVWSLLRLGRQAQIYLVIGIQRPDVSFIPGEARDNITSRLAAGPLTTDGLGMVFGRGTSIMQRVTSRSIDEATGHVTDTIVKGRATVELGDGPEPIQVYWVADPAEPDTLSADERAVIDGLRAAANTAPTLGAGLLSHGGTRPATADHGDTAAPPGDAPPAAAAPPDSPPAATAEPVHPPDDDWPLRPAQDLLDGDRIRITLDEDPVTALIDHVGDSDGDGLITIEYRVDDPDDDRHGQLGALDTDAADTFPAEP